MRSHETEVLLDASPEQVWRALTEPAQVQRWFAPNVSIVPGAGGSSVATWAEGVSWANGIEVWEPGRHLRLVEDRPRDGGTPVRLVQDWFLEARAGGQTRLRLVHSGFGDSAAWDGEFDATRQGWPACFAALRMALGPFAGRPCRFTHVSRLTGKPVAGALETLLGAVPASAAVIGQGPRARVLDLGGGALLTFAVERGPEGQGVVFLQVRAYGDQDPAEEWKLALERLFPAAA